jgi:serine/threonine protein kinase
MGIYKIVKKLGRGGFGDVYLVTDQKDKFFAIKEINKKNVDSNES